MRTSNLFAALLVVASFSTFAACASTGEDDTTDASDDSTSAGKFDLWQSTDGWHFHLKSGNGAILMTSEAYTSRTGAINGVLSTETNGVDSAQYEVVPAAKGYLLHLKAGNGETIGYTEVYSSKSNATRAVASCVKATTSYLDRREALTTGARVEVAEGEKAGNWHFNMFAKNGQIVVSSESYTSEAAAYNGAFAVQTDGQAASAYVVSANQAGGYYFTVTAQNGQVVGVSQQYTTKASATAAVTAATKLMPVISVF